MSSQYARARPYTELEVRYNTQLALIQQEMDDLLADRNNWTENHSTRALQLFARLRRQVCSLYNQALPCTEEEVRYNAQVEPIHREIDDLHVNSVIWTDESNDRMPSLFARLRCQGSSRYAQECPYTEAEAVYATEVARIQQQIDDLFADRDNYTDARAQIVCGLFAQLGRMARLRDGRRYRVLVSV